MTGVQTCALPISRHPVFQRKGDQLFCQVSVPMTAAALGTHLDLPTLEADVAGTDEADRTVRLDVASGTQSGETVTIKGFGVPRLRGSGRGDLKVQVVVETPARIDDEQRALLEQLAKLREEERPEALMGTHHKGVFHKIKDAFK